MDLFLTNEEKRAALNYALENLPCELTGKRGFLTHIKQLIGLLAFQWHFRDGCKSRIGKFAAELGWSENTVRKYIRHAQQLGWLYVEGRCNSIGGQTSNRYWIDWEAIQSAGKEAPPPPLSAPPPPLSGGLNSYLEEFLDSSEKEFLVCVSSDGGEEHTLNSAQEEMQAAIGDVCQRLPNSAAVREAAATLTAAGWQAAEIAAIPLPKFWDDAPTPKQLVEQAIVTRNRAVKEANAACQARQAKGESIFRKREENAQRDRAIDEEDRLIETFRPHWESLQIEERNERLRRLAGTGAFVPRELLERYAILALAKEKEKRDVQ